VRVAEWPLSFQILIFPGLAAGRRRRRDALPRINLLLRQLQLSVANAAP
jgi:hypothetical protein